MTLSAYKHIGLWVQYLRISNWIKPWKNVEINGEKNKKILKIIKFFFFLNNWQIITCISATDKSKNRCSVNALATASKNWCIVDEFADVQQQKSNMY